MGAPEFAGIYLSILFKLYEVTVLLNWKYSSGRTGVNISRATDLKTNDLVEAAMRGLNFRAGHNWLCAPRSPCFKWLRLKYADNE